MLVIKTDSYETHPVIGFEINMAVKNKGAKLNILSDKRGKLSRLPDATTLVHTPGSEVAVINAMAKTILDEKLAAGSAAAIPGYAELEKALAGFTPDAVAGQSGLSAAAIRQLATDYAKAGKALILFPIGNAYPGHNADLASAVANLAILTDKLGTEGSGVLCMAEKNNSQGAVDMGFYATSGLRCRADHQRVCKRRDQNPVYRRREPGRFLSYRAAVTAALDEVEFLVVSDLFMTETAAMADVVLPACSFAEKEGTFTSVDRRVQHIKPAIRKIGRSRSDFEIFGSLIAKLGGQAPATPAAVFGGIAASVPGYAGMSYASLGEAGVFAPVAVKAAFVVPKAVAVEPVSRQAGPGYRQRPVPQRHPVPVRRRPHACLPRRVLGTLPRRCR